MAERNEITQKCDDLLPAAERTALLFHMSYLYLSGYPDLEKLIRERALNARLLFVSTETVMFKSVCTSDNLVKTLFPIIKAAIERNKPEMAKTYLTLAGGWIEDIIKAAEDMVKKYEKENKQLSTTTSHICAKKQEKKEKNTMIELAELELEKLDKKLKKIVEEQTAKQKDIEMAKSEYSKHIETITNQNSEMVDKLSGLFFFTAALYLDSSEKMQDTAGQVLNSLEKQLEIQRSEMADLKKDEVCLENDMMKKRMELMRLQLQQGTIPSPENLEKVRESMCKIQTVMLEILKFWKFVGELLKKLAAKTFSGDALMNDLDTFKDMFIQGITNAEKDWLEFGQSCKRAQQMFEVQSKDAYKFLEMTPSSLSAPDWEKECAVIEARLYQICQTPPSASTE